MKNRGIYFPSHFHINVEVLIVIKGEYTLSVNGKRFVLREGELAFIDSYDVHGYESRCDDIKTDDLVLLIPSCYLNSFFARRGGGRIKNNIISDSELCKKLMYIAENFFGASSESTVSAAAELLLSLLCDRLEFTEKSTHGDEAELIRAILIYIGENFRNKISLGVLSAEFGYCEEHISRTFHHYIRQRLTDYVNSMRCEYIMREKEKGGRKIRDIVYDCGFESMASYYRNMHLYTKREY